MADFLDKVKEGIDRGVTAVSIRSKELLEAARISSQIGRLSDQKKSALEELGSIVYAAYLDSEADQSREIKAKCEEIAVLDRQIDEKENELKEIHLAAKRNLGIPLCRSCQGELDEGDKFCRQCGTKVES